MRVHFAPTPSTSPDICEACNLSCSSTDSQTSTWTRHNLFHKRKIRQKARMIPKSPILKTTKKKMADLRHRKWRSKSVQKLKELCLEVMLNYVRIILKKKIHRKEKKLYIKKNKSCKFCNVV